MIIDHKAISLPNFGYVIFYTIDVIACLHYYFGRSFLFQNYLAIKQLQCQISDTLILLFYFFEIFCHKNNFNVNLG